MNLNTAAWVDLGQGASLTVQNTGGGAMYVRVAASLPGAGVAGDTGDFCLMPGQMLTLTGLAAAAKHAYARPRGKATPHTCAVYVQ